MNIRNYNYTIFKGNIIELFRSSDGQYYLFQREGKPLDSFFHESPQAPGVYERKVTLNKDFFVGFSCDVKALYKDCTFDVEWVRGNTAMLGTADEIAATRAGLNFVDRWDYRKEVPLTEIEKMWEQRKPSSYGLPMPEGLNSIEEIPLPRKN